MTDVTLENNNKEIENTNTEKEVNIEKKDKKEIDLNTLFPKIQLPEQVQKIIFKGKPSQKKIEEASRTIIIENVNYNISLLQIVDFLSSAGKIFLKKGPVAYIRYKKIKLQKVNSRKRGIT
jgi:hypothetical protein